MGKMENEPFLLRGRAYEDEATRELAISSGYRPVVPPKRNRTGPWGYDRAPYKRRNRSMLKCLACGHAFANEFAALAVDDWFICPHDAGDPCACRKPETGSKKGLREGKYRVKMVKQIVFDFGNVLVRFEPEKYLRPFVKNDAEAVALRNLIYLSKPWKDGDFGRISREDTILQLCRTYPEKEELLRRVLAHCSEILSMPEGTPVFLTRLKQAGYGIYYISNTNTADFCYMMNEHPILRTLQGIASFKEGILKPDPAIFQLFLARYRLQAEECLFVDDMAINTNAAAALGFQTITLQNADALEAELLKHPALEACFHAGREK